MNYELEKHMWRALAAIFPGGTVREYRWYAKIPGRFVDAAGVSHSMAVRTSAWSVDPPKDPPPGTIVEYRDVHLVEVVTGGGDPGCGEAAPDPAQ